MSYTNILGDIAKKAEQAACIRPEDYQDKAGYWVCGRCHTRKQCDFIVQELHIDWKVFCTCSCETEKRDNDIAYQKERERRDALKSERLSDMDTPAARSMTLDRDDGKNPFMANLAKQYIDNYDMMKASGKGGLILWGPPGTGKTFYATAIGNALMKKHISVTRITAAELVEAQQGMYDGEKRNVMSKVNSSDVLILDDIGAERDTSFARESLFSLIDTRTKQGKILIVTTNMTYEQMQNPKDKYGNTDVDYQRIFDRLLGVCAPVKVAGESHRKQASNEARDLIRGIM